ncbi:hypothetical protein SAMN05880501_10594 [Ureibacillus xyleni]|uniref:Acetaldehyde dehydrogenase n=1 Tax=Ureibacillus xyleni TaxID=614648 RepID=A0A285SKL7_9BACL|nr:DUF779 domain-containing protein [Ureibacillus xyleni]SOC08508.1 hypothetical protein SAMN05880501_10594 [Ureibacillus xyleni]
MEKVIATENALSLIKQLQERFGKLIFVHSEGCCDGTSPVCMTESDFYLGSQDEQIGMVLDVPYYMHRSNLPYWEHMQIVIDVVDGLGNTFSLESSENKSFIIRSRKIEL